LEWDKLDPIGFRNPSAAMNKSIWQRLYFRHATLTFVAITLLLLGSALYSIWRLTEHSTRQSVLETTAASNLAITQLIATEVWPSLAPLLPVGEVDANRALSNPNLPAIDTIVRRFSPNTDIVKLKIFNLNGLTLYSSEARQIGEDKSATAAFAAPAEENPSANSRFGKVSRVFQVHCSVVIWCRRMCRCFATASCAWWSRSTPTARVSLRSLICS